MPVRPPVSAVAVAQDRISREDVSRSARLPHRAVPPGAQRARAARRPCARSRSPRCSRPAAWAMTGRGRPPSSGRRTPRRPFARLGSVPCVLERRLALESRSLRSAGAGRRRRGGRLPRRREPAPERDSGDHGRTGAVSGPSTRWTRRGSIACRVATALEYVGVLGVEMFVADGGRLYVNELAPRPHNSGHYTLDACSVDQFEQQVRALCASSARRARGCSRPVAMVNLLGDLWRRASRAGSRSSVGLACGCTSTARPSRGRGGRWAT